MPVLGIDLGGTKLALAVFMETGELVSRKVIALEGRKGTEAGNDRHCVHAALTSS